MNHASKRCFNQNDEFPIKHDSNRACNRMFLHMFIGASVTNGRMNGKC